MNGSSDEENDKGFASIPAKKSLYENSDSGSNNYNDRKNNNYDDVALGDNLHKKPRAISTEKSDNNRTKGPSKRQSQVSFFEFMKPKKKALCKGDNINIDVSQCNSTDADSSDDCSECSIAAKIDSLIAIKQKELKSWKKMIAQKKELEILKNLCRDVNLGDETNDICSTIQI